MMLHYSGIKRHKHIVVARVISSNLLRSPAIIWTILLDYINTNILYRIDILYKPAIRR